MFSLELALEVNDSGEIIECLINRNMKMSINLPNATFEA